MKQLAELLRQSKKTVLYTGAGISAQVVGQAARGSGQAQAGSPLAAKPTATHFALGVLGQRGLIHGWVQQNHDGLPQKAGFPQHLINEVHGGWFDPGNPVVKYSGSLHTACSQRMIDDAESADLVLVLGSSLSGLNADRVPLSCARRSLRGAALGAVCVNLQQTPQDGRMSLRLFERSDAVLQLLLRELGLGSVPTKCPQWPQITKCWVPYGPDGQKVPSGAPRMLLDLTDGAQVQLAPGHNVQGARQPKYLHIGAADGKHPGKGRVVRRTGAHFTLAIEGVDMHLGVWWLFEARDGLLAALPVVNAKPELERPQA